ncbi:MAG: ABC-F family ATP-binding cassette domain-containing protein, partial [SAR324 cluster bacterium]|nr:ABC-F family ATP-binding cassette domain-containing protein [SAR324 cluster bacterium]
MGPNGIGKTTLVKTFLGESAPISGSVILGHNVKPGYYSQGSLELPEHMNVLEALMDANSVEVPEARSYLARFLFRGDDVFKSVADLSGGERSRLAIARLMINEPNVLILDEPTTHLDIPSREALEQVLLAYSGALLFVS